MALEFEMEYTWHIDKKKWQRNLDRGQTCAQALSDDSLIHKLIRSPARGEFDSFEKSLGLFADLQQQHPPVQNKKFMSNGNKLIPIETPEITYWKEYWSTPVFRPVDKPKKANIGMGGDPKTEFHITDNAYKIGMGVLEPNAVLKNIPTINGIIPERDANSPEFIEAVKALQYDLDRAKDKAAEDKLMDEFAKTEFSDLWNSRAVKDKEAEFFNNTWDLRDGQRTKNLSNNTTNYSDYAEFLEEYFDEGDK